MRPPFCHRMNLQTRQHVNACVSLGTARLSLQVLQKDKYFLLLVSRRSCLSKWLNFPEILVKTQHDLQNNDIFCHRVWVLKLILGLGTLYHWIFKKSNFVISLFSWFIMAWWLCHTAQDSLCGTTEPEWEEMWHAWKHHGALRGSRNNLSPTSNQESLQSQQKTGNCRQNCKRKSKRKTKPLFLFTSISKEILHCPCCTQQLMSVIVSVNLVYVINWYLIREEVPHKVANASSLMLMLGCVPNPQNVCFWLLRHPA